nr:MAG TPA: hypothetical protein [Caudoviricetes sp.]
MKSELGTKEITALRNELQDLLESAYAAGSDDNESDLVKMFYHSKADAYESSLSLINVALGGNPDEEEKS